VAIHSNGTSPNSTGDDSVIAESSISTPADMIDGEQHDVRVRYEPQNNRMEVHLDGRLVLSTTVNLSQRLDLSDGRAYVGFTSSTGVGAAQHDILNWSHEALRQ
jgi:hypothetical protein